MKKLTHGLGVLAIGIISVTTFSGCSSTPDPAAGTGGTPSTGGTSGVAGAQPGVQINPPMSYVVLSGADAAPNPMPAPAAWVSATCSTCHQANGEGFASLAPEVRHTPVSYATWVVRHGRVFNGVQTSMVAFPTTTTDPVKMPAISDADLTAVLAWLDSMPKPTTPKGLYLDYCGNCHGPTDGTGGIVPVKITNETIMAVNQKVRVGEGMDPSMRNGFMPPEDMTALTDAELGMIQQYILAK